VRRTRLLYGVIIGERLGFLVYDPTLGRFLSADPYVQFPETTQGLNRYTYVNNNPLSLTDPSGYFFKSVFKSIGKAFSSARRRASSTA
jgi:uncharacterized protein RhaS with RHS repeats